MTAWLTQDVGPAVSHIYETAGRFHIDQGSQESSAEGQTNPEVISRAIQKEMGEKDEAQSELKELEKQRDETNKKLARYMRELGFEE
jgi:hypothetical protein